MEFTVLNTEFQKIFILDVYESIVWVDKFSEPGTFELYTTVTQDILDNIKPDCYIVNPDSDHTMIVEDISIESDAESGDHIKIVGRSLESILDRRIVWTQTNIDGDLQAGITTLINDAIISPSNSDRRISNFIMTQSVDPKITSLTMDHQYTGDNLLDIITDLCEENKIGFKILLDDSNQFVFSLYVGDDRSYNQSTLPYVVFRPSFDNVINSNYTEKSSVLKNVALVAGEGEGTSRITRTVGTVTGLSRKEVYVDARDIRKENLSTEKYNAKLDSKGIDKLSEINKDKKEVDGKCETTLLYKYRQDFFLGDIVQMANEYGMESPSKVTEFTWSYSTSGFETYPTFTAEEEEVSS